MKKVAKPKRTELGLDLEEAFLELAAGLRGEIEVESDEIVEDILTAPRIQAIRRRLASSTKEFERQFRIPARTMEAYEQGRRRPDAATEVLLRVLERDPEAVRQALVAQGRLIQAPTPPEPRPRHARSGCRRC